MENNVVLMVYRNDWSDSISEEIKQQYNCNKIYYFNTNQYCDMIFAIQDLKKENFNVIAIL